jgi:hypothetical protein
MIRAPDLLGLVLGWAICLGLIALVHRRGRIDADLMLPLMVLGIIAPVLAFAGWRDERDETPRNVAATIFFMILPLATPLAFVAYGAGLEWTFGAWVVGAAVWGLGASASARAHPMPGPGRILLLATAWILSALGGLFVLAQIGLGA